MKQPVQRIHNAKGAPVPFVSEVVLFVLNFNHQKFSIVKHEDRHTECLWPVLRLADKTELEDESGLPPQQAVRDSVMNSEIVYTLVIHNEVLGIMGVGRSPANPKGGKIWFLGAERLAAEIDFELIRQSRSLVPALMENFEIAFNVVSAENTSSIRWLKWCGFEFISMIPEHGVAKKPFWLFAMARTSEIRKNWISLFTSSRA